MAITLRIEWSNQFDELLKRDARPQVHVSAGGVEVPPMAGSSSGAFPKYEVPDTAQSLRVEVAVIGTIQLKFGAKPRPWRKYRDDISKSRITMPPDLPVLLWACQEFRVVKIGDMPLEATAPLHPLMTLRKTGAAAPSAVVLHVATEFLDVTDYFFDFAAQADEDALNKWSQNPKGDRPWKQVEMYHAAHAREIGADPDNPVRMTVLGFTGGRPKMWFVTYCEPRINSIAGPEIGTFVYFRPNTDPYTKVCEIYQGKMMLRNNRYYLAPNEQEYQEGCLDAADRMIAHTDPEKKGWGKFYLVRISMDQALQRSGRPVVMVAPYPHMSDYGEAEKKEVPVLLESLLRFLHANGEIARTQAGVKLGRLGVGGFSGGGLPMGRMFRRCSSRISELYLFDATAATGYSDVAIHWAWATPGARLRISMGMNEKPLYDIFLRTLDFIGVKGALGFTVNSRENVSAWPEFSTGDEFRDAFERNPWWQYYIAEVDAIRKIDPKAVTTFQARHQFAMFAGEQQPTTFFELFLRQSGY